MILVLTVKVEKQNVCFQTCNVKTFYDIRHNGQILNISKVESETECLHSCFNYLAPLWPPVCRSANFDDGFCYLNRLSETEMCPGNFIIDKSTKFYLFTCNQS